MALCSPVRPKRWACAPLPLCPPTTLPYHLLAGSRRPTFFSLLGSRSWSSLPLPWPPLSSPSGPSSTSRKLPAMRPRSLRTAATGRARPRHFAPP
uniref:Uncharacterized protein n=1 Tax=Zea mays TaxID=4577 RepID=B6SXS8_MAIZE|nr:hypothetical protein [Zea mays]